LKPGNFREHTMAKKKAKPAKKAAAKKTAKKETEE
jgi:hypothetical protein